LIPYFESPKYVLGPFTLETFGIFAALGIYVGARIAAGRAARAGLDGKPLVDFAFWGVISGVIFGHLVHLFAYHPEELAKPFQIFKVWDGLSSFGGLLGGIVAAMVFFHVKKLRFMDYGDVFALGTAPGWAIARIGCFTVHDHPGVLTSFPLAVAFPGGARHDLGLYDALWLAAITVVLFTLARRNVLKGRLLAVLAILYALGRFNFDFLRATDVAYHDARYLGLTPAQYFCLLLVGWGTVVLVRTPAPRIAAPPPVAPPG
jgi:phosphatidylglycerol:prolipoprotein diacylglycerol transferase